MTSTMRSTRAADPDIVRHYLRQLRYDTDDDLRYQIEEVEHVFWMARDAGIEHDTEYLDLLAAQQAACHQVLDERARYGYQYPKRRGGYDREHLDDLKRRVPLLEVIGNGIQLRRRGRNYVALCPFHQERTPSFTVFPATDSYYCFGCHHSGDAIDWLRAIAGMDFRGAVETLEVLAGVPPAVQSRPGRAQPGQPVGPTTRGHEPHRQQSDASPFVFHNGEVRHS